jgi:GNAT superfamily N-acetyltransferase
MACEGPVRLRRATVEDAAGIAQVHAYGWQRAHEGLAPPEYIAAKSSWGREGFWRGELEVEAADRTPWVAELDGQIVGFAIGGLGRDDDAGPETGEIYQLFVTPECWGSGIRTNLLEHVVRDLREHDFARVVFWVLAADETMRAFAEHRGMKPDGSTRIEESGGAQVEEVRYAVDLR